MTVKTRVYLTQYNYYPKSDSKDETAEYSVEQNNGTTSIEQTMLLESTNGFMDDKWVASIELKDFPPQDTAHDAAHKLAEWLERLASAIRNGTYTLPLKHTREYMET